MAAACDSGETCPRVFETEHGTVVLQGYVVREADVPALAVPPAGEAVVPRTAAGPVPGVREEDR